MTSSLALLSWAVLGNVVWGEAPTERAPRYTYATLVNDDPAYLLGARVLAFSLRDVKSAYPLLVFHTVDLHPSRLDLLHAEGIETKRIPPIQAPSAHGGIPIFFDKLSVWNFTDYDRVVYIDSDAIVLQNIDELFKCGSFCAAYRTFEVFNAGVLVLKPSETKLAEILAVTKSSKYEEAMTSSKSIPGTIDVHDQGLLNLAFKDCISGPLFNPSLPSKPECQRLPSTYNGDWPLLMLNSKKMDQIKVLHYTMGPCKPWAWFWPPLFPRMRFWQGLRNRLELCPSFAACLRLGDLLAPLLTAACLLVGIGKARQRWGARFEILKPGPGTSTSCLPLHRAWPLWLFCVCVLVAFFSVPRLSPSHYGVGLFCVWLSSLYLPLVFNVLGCLNYKSGLRRSEKAPFHLAQVAACSVVLTVLPLVVVVAGWNLTPLIPRTGDRLIFAVSFALLDLALVHALGSFFVSKVSQPLRIDLYDQ